MARGWIVGAHSFTRIPQCDVAGVVEELFVEEGAKVVEGALLLVIKH